MYTVKVFDKWNSKADKVYKFNDKEQAKKFFREQQKSDKWCGGQAYDENHISIFADERSKSIPVDLLNTLSSDCGSLGRYM